MIMDVFESQGASDSYVKRTMQFSKIIKGMLISDSCIRV